MVESVSKGLVLPNAFRALLGEVFDMNPGDLVPGSRPERTIPFTPLEEVEKALRRQVEAIDVPGLVRRAVQDGLDRLRGRV